MKIVCAWCKCYMSGNRDAKEISHGICKDCEEKFNEQLEEVQRN